MSSKNKNQKPANPKPDAGDEATSPQDTTQESIAEGDQHLDGSEQAEQPDSAQEPDIADQAEQPETPAVIETVAEEPPSDAQPVKTLMDGLATRLTKVVSAIQTSGKPDTVHALHKVEHILGSLKVSLPAAFDACDDLADEGLKADLQSLHAAL